MVIVRQQARTSHSGLSFNAAKLYKCVNRQHKWDTFRIKANGHLGACSCSVEEVEYRLKEGASHDSRDVEVVMILPACDSENGNIPDPVE